MITSSEHIDELIKEVSSVKPHNSQIAVTQNSYDSSSARKTSIKYSGDYIDESGAIDKEGKDSDQFTSLKFEDPAELINFFYEPLNSGRITLHKWQTETLEHLAVAHPTSNKPHKFCLVAANGSGKDAFIVAPFAIWFALSKVQSRCIITSSSGTQLTSQTEGYIKNLAEEVNKYFGCEIFRIRQRFIKCRLSGSEIRLFATDEAGKAEGYHPIVPGAEMAIIINEWKSVSEEITGALRRCTGYNYWIGVSTPGEPRGSFYRAATSWPNVLRITSYNCPHLSEDDRDEDKRELGEHSALFRSKHLALFTSIGGQVIITLELIEKLILSPPAFSVSGFVKRVGIDLAAGGDENCITYTQGMKCLREYAFRETDTTITADRIEADLITNDIPKDHDYIFADDGGVGHSIIDMLVRRGWRIKRILNQWAAIKKKDYGNRGAENWSRVKRIFEEGFFDVTTLSEKTREQLYTRQYKQNGMGSRIMLESKKEAKAHGRPSPDRADAFILSLTGLTINDFMDAKQDSTAPKTVGLTMDQMVEYYKNQITKKGLTIESVTAPRDDNKQIYCSLAAAMEKD